MKICYGLFIKLQTKFKLEATYNIPFPFVKSKNIMLLDNGIIFKR